MDTSAATPSDSQTWAKLSVVCSVAAGVSYALVLAVPLPLPVTLVGISIFGPALAIAAGGLYHVIRLERSTVSFKIGVAADIAAGVIVTTMLFAQVAFKEWLELRFPDASVAGPSSPAYQAANGVQLGLDASWDVFLAIGTFLIALNMWTHPRFGTIFAAIGMVVSSSLLVLNFATFPEPPEHAGLVDLGPVIGLWYVAVAIRTASSLGWVEQRARAAVELR